MKISRPLLIAVPFMFIVLSMLPLVGARGVTIDSVPSQPILVEYEEEYAEEPVEHLNESLNEADGAPESSHATRVAPWVSSPLSGPVAKHPIWNFGVIEDGIVYRSAQPTEEDYEWLLSQGFKSIVSFRRESGDHGKHVLGLGFKNYLWLDIEDETGPTDEQALKFLDFVADSKNWPVLIHCKVGVGRTGTFAALIRYAIDGWTMEEALEESRLYRNGTDLIQGQIDWLNRWAANHPPACHRPVIPTQPAAQ